MYEVVQLTFLQKKWIFSTVAEFAADTEAVILVLLLHINVFVLEGMQRNPKV